MDWAIQAAKKKTQRLPGSSRSIVESLNAFNNITAEGQSQINMVLKEADEWLKYDVLMAKAENSKNMRQDEEKSSMVSPERTINNLQLEENDESEGIDQLSPKTNEEHESIDTPKRAGDFIPSTTPKSLAGDNNENVTKQDIENVDRPSAAISTGDATGGKGSPWSPYKAEKPSKKSVVQDPSAQSLRVEETKTSERWGFSEEIRSSTAMDNNNVATRDIDQLARDRSQRRSNMFVPLPSRDPLVVQQANPLPSKSNVVSASNLSSKASNNSPSNPYLGDTEKGRPFHLKGTQVLPRKGTNARATQSPTHIKHSTYPSNPSRVTSSVFDRLSSLPTKSFENKLVSKGPGKKMSASSFIDITGSPIRRTSLSIRNVTTETSIQDTLKNIFSNRDASSNRHGTTPQLIRDRIASRGSKRGKGSRVEKHAEEKISPARNTNISRHQSTPANNKRSTQTPASEARSVERGNARLDKRPSTLKYRATRAENPANTPVELRPPHSRSRSISIEPDQILETKEDACIEPQQESSNVSRSDTATGNKLLNNKSKHQDRLTKFQLLPPKESEKDDLKKKLNKRLSEVIRTQQNQVRRRNDQQKRKSQLEDDYKRRTRIWNETKETPLKVSNNNVRANHNAISPQHNSILHDLNVVDHRTIIGDSNQDMNRSQDKASVGNQTLPEIQSDSDDDTGSTLVSWAKSPYLQEQLYIQRNWDPRKIFGPIPPLHIDQIFQTSRLNKFKPLQTSSKKI